MKHHTLFILIALTLTSAASLLGQTHTRIAYGDAAGTSTFTSGEMGAPYVDETGNVVFNARRRTGSFGNYGIYRWNGKSVQTLVEQNASAPGGGKFTSMKTGFSLNARGDVVFFSQVSTSSAGYPNLFLKTATSLRTIARIGATAPGGAFFEEILAANIADAGDVIVNSKNQGTPGQGFYRLTGTTLSPAVLAGDSAGGSTISAQTTLNPPPAINDAGQILFQAWDGSGFAVFLSSPAGLTLLTRGDGMSYGKLMINNAGHFTFTGGNTGIHLGTEATGSAQVATFNTPVINGPNLQFSIRNASINENGLLVFTGGFATLYLRDTDGVHAITSSTEPAPPAPYETVGGNFGSYFDTPAINNLGEIAFINNPGGGNALFFYNGTFQKIMGAGGTLGGKNVKNIALADTGATPSQRPLNDAGQIAYKVTFTDDSTAIYLYTPAPVQPVITTLPTATAVLGQPFRYAISAEHVPVKYTATPLPSGLKLNPSTGIITGTPKTAGLTTIALTAENPGGIGTSSLELNVTDLTSYQGTYTGIIGSTTSAFTTTGHLKLTLTPSALFTATIRLGALKYTLRGAFDADGAFTGTIPKTAYTLTLQIDKDHPTDQIAGSLKISGDDVATFTTARTPTLYNKNNPSPFAGYYTLALPADPTQTNPTTYPQGTGIATATVSPTGSVRLLAFLGDTTSIPLTASISLDKDGHFPLYITLYKKKGALSGRLTLLETSSSNHVEGTLLWFRTSGIGHTTVLGSRYTAPPTRPSVLDAPSALLDFTVASGDILTEPPTKSLSLSSRNRVTINTPEKFSLSLNSKTGLFTGTFLDTSGKTRTYRGILLQQQNIGHGYYKGIAHPGTITLTPRNT